MTFRFEKRRYFVALTLAEAETIRYAIHVAELNGFESSKAINEAALSLVRGSATQRSDKAIEAAERLKQVSVGKGRQGREGGFGEIRKLIRGSHTTTIFTIFRM